MAGKTKRDAPGSTEDMINKKVRSAHNTLAKSNAPMQRTVGKPDTVKQMYEQSWQNQEIKSKLSGKKNVFNKSGTQSTATKGYEDKYDKVKSGD